MEENQIITTNQNNILSEERFTDIIKNRVENKTFISMASDVYDKVPQIFKIVKNIDPTGILSSIDDVLSDNKRNRETNNIIKALYYIYIICLKNRDSIQQSIEHNNLLVQNITELYLQKSKETYQEDKIAYFKNIWFNGIIDNQFNFDEKVYVFELISSLTFDQINILKYIEEQFRIQWESYSKDNSQGEPPIRLEQYAEKEHLNIDYLIHLCVDLQGKGLLRQAKLSHIEAEPKGFVPTSYVMHIVTFLNEP